MNTVIDGHTFVDLGLSVLWAETNIGASTAADYGDYYAWAGTSTQSSYNYESAPYHGNSDGWDSSNLSYTKYNSEDYYNYQDNSSNAVLEGPKNGGEDDYYDGGSGECDDAAYKNWGDFCRMPSHAEFDNLRNNCNWTWTCQNNSNGESIYGYKVTSRKNGNSIFLPAAGQKAEYGDNNIGSSGYYWSRVLQYSFDDHGSAYILQFNDGGYLVTTSTPRYYGCSIRPVAAK